MSAFSVARTGWLPLAAYTVAFLLGRGIDAAAQARPQVAAAKVIRVSHSCAAEAVGLGLCPSVQRSPLIGAFGGISPDGQLRIFLASTGQPTLIPLKAVTLVEARHRGGGRALAGGLIGLLGGALIGSILVTTAISGEDLESGGSGTAQALFFAPLIAGTIAGIAIFGAERWRAVPVEQLKP